MIVSENFIDFSLSLIFYFGTILAFYSIKKKVSFQNKREEEKGSERIKNGKSSKGKNNGNKLQRRLRWRRYSN